MCRCWRCVSVVIGGGGCEGYVTCVCVMSALSVCVGSQSGRFSEGGRWLRSRSRVCVVVAHVDECVLGGVEDEGEV